MQPNPVLRRLGYADDDRLVIIHTDDIGMSLASVTAFDALWEKGIISSGAVMVPCPWFLKAAAYAQAHPQADLGVHITLTSEWKYYRWGPVSTRDPQSGMVDSQGCFYATSQAAQQFGEPDWVAREIDAQVERALAQGMRPTHIDTHMGTVASLKFIRGYLSAAIKHGLPPMLFRMDEAAWMAEGLDRATAGMAAAVTRQLEASGLPLLDHIERRMRLDQPERRLELAKRLLSELKPGITHFIIHPSVDTPDLREITPDWQARVADYQTFLNEEIREHIQSIGAHVIGYRQIQELMPDPAALLELPL